MSATSLCFYLKTIVKWLLFTFVITISIQLTAGSIRYWADEGPLSPRNTINAEFEDAAASAHSWSMTDSGCSVETLAGGAASVDCDIQGLHEINVEYTKSGSSHQASKYLWVTNHQGCYKWYMATCHPGLNFTSGHENDVMEHVCVWVVDPKYMSAEETAGTSSRPSTFSQQLSGQFNELGLEPEIEVLLHDHHKFSEYHSMVGFDDQEGFWVFEVQDTTSLEVLMLIRAEKTALYNCFISDTLTIFVKSSVAMNFTAENPTTITVDGSLDHNLITHPCFESLAILVNGDELLWTNDGFLTTSILEIDFPDELGAHKSTATIAGIVLTSSKIILLADSHLYAIHIEKPMTIELLQENTDFTVIKHQDWCIEKEYAIPKVDDVFMGWSDNSITIYNLTTGTNVTLTLPTTGGQVATVLYAAFSTFPDLIGVILDIEDGGSTESKVYFYHMDVGQWDVMHTLSSPAPGESHKMIFIWAGIPKFWLWSGSMIYFYMCHEYGAVHEMTSESLAPHPIQQVVMNRLGDVVLEMSDGVIYYTTSWSHQMLELELPAAEAPPYIPWFNPAAQLYMLSQDGSSVVRREYPLRNEIVNAAYPDIRCPYDLTVSDGVQDLYSMDILENVTLWVALTYPIENYTVGTSILQMFIDGEVDMVDVTTSMEFHIYDRYVQENMSLTFSNHADLDIERWRNSRSRVGFDLGPVDIPPVCYKPSHAASFITVGCLESLSIKVIGTNMADCEKYRNMENYTIPAVDSQSEAVVVDYDFETLGCPIKVNRDNIFYPKLFLCRGDICDTEIDANFIVWEEYDRAFTYSASMKSVRCVQTAQSWDQMLAGGDNWNRSSVWGPRNYESCFINNNQTGSTNLGLPYEILNRTEHVGLKFSKHVKGVYLFHAKIVDPLFSFCELETVFAVEVWGLVIQENIKVLAITVVTCLTVVMLVLFFSFYYFRDNVFKFMLEAIEEAAATE